MSNRFESTMFAILWILQGCVQITCHQQAAVAQTLQVGGGWKNNSRRLIEWEYSCPDAPGESVSVPSVTQIRIEKSATGRLCTLTLVKNGSPSIPVGRSYDGHEWERVAGPYTSIEYDCDETHCQVTLPTQSGSNREFMLTTFTSNLNRNEKVARFLEQVTFGTTRKDLDKLSADLDENADLMQRFNDWVRKQIFDEKMTSHRRYYRRLVSSIYRVPGREGEQSSPCEFGSRWRWYTFTKSDIGKQLKINKVGDDFFLSVDGEHRTKIKRLVFKGDTHFSLVNSDSYKICRVNEKIYGRFSIIYDGECEDIKIGNPPVKINGLPQKPKYTFDIDVSKESKYIAKATSMKKFEIMIHLGTISDESCTTLPYPLHQHVYAQLSNGQTLVFEPTIKWQKNTLKSPVSNGGGGVVAATGGVAQCANAPRTFLNENDCQLSKAVSTCAPYGSIEGATIQLNSENIKKFYEILQKPVYAIVDLRFDDDYTVDSPCVLGERSRWRTVDECTENVQPSTSFLFGSLIKNSKDENPQIKDIYLEDQGYCHSSDANQRKMCVKVDGKCWMSTHPDNFSVYDFKKWASKHPGNTESQNFIETPAKEGLHRLQYPNHHPSARWASQKSKLKYIGKLGDTLLIDDIPIWDLRNRYIAEEFGFYTPKPEGQNTVVCGSPDEVVNDALSIPILSITQGPPLDSIKDDAFSQQRKTVWTMVALHSKDQLRQRMAWILSQLLVISPSTMSLHNTETFLTYYDIFVRNAFGSYRDILREVAYSPLMASMLTYYRSKSSEFIWQKDGSIQYADENLAREIMQLFTIGLVDLNADGTIKLDPTGNHVKSYNNDDITEYARVWTGFTQQGPRGNVEEREQGNNSIDPMRIRVDWRDQYPKMGLKGKYVGDEYPLCLDLPSDMFLRKGAQWKLLGKSKNSDDQDLLRRNGVDDNIVVSVLDPSSILLNNLCKKRDGKCTYPGVVTINYNLPCVGIECSTNGIRIVQVDNGVHYEFVKPPCVHFPFFNSGKRISKSRTDSYAERKCVDRRLVAAAEACCDDSFVATHNTCKYTGEMVSYAEATSRCSKSGKSLCQYKSISWATCSQCCNYDGFFWTHADCEVIVIVDEDGKIALERPEESGLTKSYDSATFFRVHWDNADFPRHVNSCNSEEPSCTVYGTYCRCQIEVEDKAVFNYVPSRDEILSTLNIGGLNPALSEFAETITDNEFIMHVKVANEPYSIKTVFEVDDDFGRTLYLKNMESIVKIGSSFSFRNPPTFHGPIPEIKNAKDETEAAIDHYFYNDNTPPFLAMRFIQRFGISNPSPGFVERVATAFRTGETDLLLDGSSGKYGDLGVTVAAIILDRESRNDLLESDPSYGAVREPLLKVMALMRNFNFVQADGDLTSLDNGLQSKIGQESHEMPSVFSFFLPEYAPPGVISQSTLVSPESMLMPYSLGLVNGMISMIKFGAARCYGGFSQDYCKQNTQGRLQYLSPVEDETVVDDISTILTSGRMSKQNRAIIKAFYLKEEKNTNQDTALMAAQQLAISSPEFHATGNSNGAGSSRKTLAPQTKSCKKHKVLIHLMLKGGCDSFNMLVPHSKCGDNDLYRQYRKIRSKIAIPKKDLLKIDASGSSQQCKKFGIHPNLPILQKLYNEEDALFFAGIGVLSNLVTKSDFMHKTQTQLFAHNSMQAEISRLDPYVSSFGTGMLGRLTDMLSSKSFNVNSFAVDATLTAIQGNDIKAVKSSVNSAEGFKHFNPSAPVSNITSNMLLLNAKESKYDGFFSQFWSSSLHDNIKRNDQLYWAERDSAVDTTFPNSQLGQQLLLVSKLVKSNECRGVDKDIFYVEMGQFDHHSGLKHLLDEKFIELNDALDSFVNELKTQGKWDDTTIVVSSDFGRTLTPNSGMGTDHGWSGHSFIVGGQVNGGRILGEYPTNLMKSSPLNIGRGRLIPTMPWDAVWNGVIGWLGVKDDESLDYILPNRNSFPDSILFDANDLYSPEIDKERICENEGEIVTCIPGDIPSSLNDDDTTDTIEFEGENDAESSTRSKKNGPVTAAILILVMSIIAGVCAYFYNRRTGRLSEWAHILIAQVTTPRLKLMDDGSGSDTGTLNQSFETVDIITLLHKKNGDGVEIANDEVIFRS